MIHMTRSANLIRDLEKAGWRRVRVRGSHHQFAHPERKGMVLTVPHPRKALGKGLTRAIRRQAGLE
jgi:predicted RNA binding protein YcfA (HicA-like mRNA interferase family)